MDEKLNADTLENQIEQRPDKQSSKSYTQSEVDQMVKVAINKKMESFSDYDTIKTEHNALLTEKKEKEMANKSEVEKLQTLLTEATNGLTNATNEITTYKRKDIRSDVLNDGKYLQMPRAYKNMVKLSDDREEVKSSAEDALAEYEKDSGKKVADTFGVQQPKDTSSQANGVPVGSPEGIAAELRSKVASIIKNSGRG